MGSTETARERSGMNSRKPTGDEAVLRSKESQSTAGLMNADGLAAAAEAEFCDQTRRAADRAIMIQALAGGGTDSDISEAQSKVECEVQPVVGGLRRWEVRDGLTVGGTGNVLQGCSYPEIVVAVEKIAHVGQPVTTPSTSRGAAVAGWGIITSPTGWRSLRVVKVHGASTGRHLNPAQWLRDVNAAAERDHEFVIAALHRSKIGDNRILVIRCAKSHREPSVRLEQPIEAITVAESDQWRGTQVARCAAHRNCGSCAEDEVVMVNFITVTFTLRKGDHGQQQDERNQGSFAHFESV